MGAPWHPHRGFETVSYSLDGEIAHHDTITTTFGTSPTG